MNQLDRNGDLIPNDVQEPRKDTRDLRCPECIGNLLLPVTARWLMLQDGTQLDNTILNRADHVLPYKAIESYPQDETIAIIAAREYRQELEQRAANGDKYAVSAIKSLDEKGKVEGYDLSGN